MSALSSNSLIVPLNSDNIADHPFQALVNSGSTHCFINTRFAAKHKLHTNLIPLITLHLFDRTSNSVITQAVNLQITFSSWEKHEVLYYVTRHKDGFTAPVRVMGMGTKGFRYG